MRLLNRFAVAGLLAAAALTAQGQVATPAVLASTDPTGGGPVYLFDVGTGTFSGTISAGLRITGMAYDEAARRVYILSRGSSATQSVLYTLDISNTDPATGPTLVGNVNGAASNITSGGLAWDGANNRLIATFSGNVYTLDPTNANLVLLRSFGSSQNFNGADIDPVSGSLYLANSASSVASPLAGRGVYRIDPPFDTSAPIKIATYPLKPASTQETDIDGVAAAPGVIYLSTDETQALYRLKLSDLTYDTPLSQPYTGTGALVGGAAYVASATAGADVAVVIRNNAEASVPATGQAGFTVTIRNIGSQTATAVTGTLPLPGGTSFVSATGGAVLSSGSVTFSAGDLASGQSASFSVTLSSASAFTATVNATTTAADVYLGNNTGSISSAVGAPDLLVSVTAPTNCTVLAGQQATFNVNVYNAGTRAGATTLTFPLPAGAMFVSSTPAGISAGGTVSIDLGTLAAGATSAVQINLVPGDGLLFGITATASVTGEANLADNTASAFSTAAIFSTAPIRALLSTVSGASNSTFPGLSGNLIMSPGYTLDSSRSANGQWMCSNLSASIDTQDFLLVRTNLVTGVSSVMGQEGVTSLPGGFLPAFNTFLTPGVNDSGDYAYSGRNSDVAATDMYAVKNIGGVFTQIAREGGSIPALPGTTYGSAISSGGFTNTGKGYWVASIVGNPAGQDEAAFSDDGNVVVFSRGTTTPAGAGGPVTDILNTGFYMSADGTRYLFQATTTVGGSRTNAVVGTVGMSDATAIVVQTVTLPGFSSPVSAISSTVMTPEGRWLVRGSNSDGEDWVISGTTNTVTAANIVIRTGPIGAPLPIVTGSTETWDPGISTTTNLVANAANQRGDILVVGKSLGDSRNDIVFVLNGTTVIAREGDPVDANNNGMFDDGLFLQAINFDDQIVLTNEAAYATAKLRDFAGVCSSSTSSVAHALIRIPLPPAANVTCCRGTTCITGVAPASCVDTPGVHAISIGAACTSNTFTGCCYADFDKNGTKNIDDIFIYLNAWFSSSPFTKVGGNGTAAPSIDDIFIFLNAWFTGCT